MFLLLPNSIAKVNLLAEEEREVAARGVVLAGTSGTDSTKWKFDQVLECLRAQRHVSPSAGFYSIKYPTGTQNFDNLVQQVTWQRHRRV